MLNAKVVAILALILLAGSAAGQTPTVENKMPVAPTPEVKSALDQNAKMAPAVANAQKNAGYNKSEIGYMDPAQLEAIAAVNKVAKDTTDHLYVWITISAVAVVCFLSFCVLKLAAASRPSGNIMADPWVKANMTPEQMIDELTRQKP